MLDFWKRDAAPEPPKKEESTVLPFPSFAVDAKVPAHNSVLISLLVARKGDKFCATDERDGWYLPAGRVDLGESFATGALREAKEEAGLDAKLTGLLRFEEGPRRGLCRYRMVFAGLPMNDNPLKSIPDEETKGASWLTPDELAKKRLRDREIPQMFRWSAQTRVCPLSLIECVDGGPVSHDQVTSELILSVQLVIREGEGKRYFVVTNQEKKEWGLPCGVMKSPQMFASTGIELIKLLQGGCFDNFPAAGAPSLTGVLHIKHVAPRGAIRGQIQVTYLATTSASPPPSDPPGDTGRWEDYETLQALNMSAQTRELLRKAAANEFQPCKMIEIEGSPYMPIA